MASILLIGLFDDGMAGGILLLLLGLGLYFLPSIIGRKHRQSNSITILNLLLGWTVLGWVGALIWALSNDRPASVVVTNGQAKAPASVADELTKLQALRDAGTLTPEEFQREKERVLQKS